MKNINKKEIESWIIKYDTDCDHLFIRRKVLPKDARLFMTKGGYLVYLTPKKEVVGVMLEWFSAEIESWTKKLNKGYFEI